jgi:hypothetical protein
MVVITPLSTDPSAGSQLNNLLFDFVKTVESTPAMNPPQASRLYFLFGSLLWNAYATLDKKFSFVDGFSAPSFSSSWRPCTNESDKWNAFYSRLVICLEELQKQELSHLVPPPMPSSPAPPLQEFRHAVNTYLARRWNDGHRQTSDGFTYPNQGHYIRVGGPPQNLEEELPDVNTWCPLSILQPDGTYKNQSYVTPLFGNVTHWFSEDEWKNLFDIAEAQYPTPEVFQRQVLETVDLSSTLTSRQKLVAEVWAGSEKGKASPPSKWVLFLGILLAVKRYPTKESVALIGGLTFTLFHSAVTAWAVKAKYLQPRPVQVLRQQYFDAQVTSPLTGDLVNGSEWLPYLGTPGFPDYVSGHSVFSMGCAVFLQMALGSDRIPFDGVFLDTEYLRMWSGVFDSCTEPFLFHYIPLLPGCSKVDPGNEPLAPLSMGWTSWTDLANETSDSRRYGGIHHHTSCHAGVVLGCQVAKHIYGHIDWKKLKLHVD